MQTTAEFVAENAATLNEGHAETMCSPDAMIAAAAHVDREYGYGYRIGLVRFSWTGSGLFVVRASDGSEFRLYADPYGNVARVPDIADYR